MDIWRLVAHRNWITLRFFGRELRLCARCSGYLIGFFAFTFLRNLFGVPIFYSIKIPFQLFTCLLLILPLTFDWLTQSWGWRESNNILRLFTGTSLGISLSLFSAIEVSNVLKTLIYISSAAFIVFSGFFGKSRCYSPLASDWSK